MFVCMTVVPALSDMWRSTVKPPPAFEHIIFCSNLWIKPENVGFVWYNRVFFLRWAMPATSAAAGLKRSQNRTLKRQQAKTDRLLGNRSVQDRISKAVADAKEEAAVEWIRKLDALKKTSGVRERTPYVNDY